MYTFDFKQVFILTCLIQLSLSEVISSGICNRNIPTVKHFNAKRYLGRWYEYAKYPNVFEKGGKCIYANYGLLQNGDIGIYNFNINEVTGKPNDIRGTAKLAGPGKLKVRFSSMPGK
ncbi:apolipoprotein D-like [Musca autumnalis]|uniref:apolipoprotein D-like n=1 Tax=Musca autumnalis TaxID=221902 RepID=UPI003CEDC120